MVIGGLVQAEWFPGSKAGGIGDEAVGYFSTGPVEIGLPHLIAIGCMGIPNGGFEFDSSFLNPRTERKFSTFVKLMRQHERRTAGGSMRVRSRSCREVATTPRRS